MVAVTGTSGNDFIHMAGDGRIAPPGYNDIIGITDTGDTIDPGAGDDIVYAGNGANTITDSGGTDEIHGGTGSDDFIVNQIVDISGLAEILDGGSGGGHNTLHLIAGGAFIDLSQSTFLSIDGLIISNTSSTDVVVSAAQLSGLENFISSHSSSASILRLASSGNVSLSGVQIEGNLEIRGASGNDNFELNGDIRDLTVRGEAGNDKIQLKNTAGTGVFLYTLDGGDGNDTLKAPNGIDTLIGGLGKDTLIAGKFGDTLDGGKDDDRLTGGGGQDILIGGADADTFIYTKSSDSEVGATKHDVIKDFNQAVGDKIDLSAIDADTTLAGNQAFHLGGGVFSHSAGEVIQFSDGAGHTILQADLNGDGLADFEILLNGAPALSNIDFIL